MTAAIYVTVDHLGGAPSRPPCQGCSPPSGDGQSESAVPPRSAEYKIVGASATIALCRDCAIHSIKSLAARFVMFDPRATRDLMDFFAADAAKKRPRRRPAAKKRGKRAGVIDVVGAVAPLLLGGGKKAP